jgi:hypothetical protein
MNWAAKLILYVTAGVLFSLLARSWWHAVDDQLTRDGWKQCIGCKAPAQHPCSKETAK